MAGVDTVEEADWCRALGLEPQPLQEMDLEAVKHQQRRLAALLKYRGNVPDYFRRKRRSLVPPEHQIKDSGTKRRGQTQFRCTRIDPNGEFRDPALDFLREGLVTFHEPAEDPLIPLSRKFNSPNKSFDREFVVDLDGLELNIIEEEDYVDLPETVSGEYRKEVLLAAADVQFQKLKRVRIAEAGNMASSRMLARSLNSDSGDFQTGNSNQAQMRYQNEVTQQPYVNMLAGNLANTSLEDLPELVVAGTTASHQQLGADSGLPTKLSYQRGERTDERDPQIVNYLNSRSPTALAPGGEKGASGAGAGAVRSDSQSNPGAGANTDANTDAGGGAGVSGGADTGPQSEHSEQSGGNRSHKVESLSRGNTNLSKSTSWCACNTGEARNKNACAVCGGLGVHQEDCQYKRNRRCKTCDKVKDRYSRETTFDSGKYGQRASVYDEYGGGHSSDSEGEGRPGAPRLKRPRAGRRPGELDSESQSRQTDEKSANANLKKKAWSETVSTSEQLETETSESESTIKGKGKQKRKQKATPGVTIRETGSAVYETRSQPRKDQYRIAYQKAVQKSRVDALMEHLSYGEASNDFFHQRTSRCTFSYFSHLTQYSRGLELFELAKPPRDRFRERMLGRKKPTPKQLTFGNEDPDWHIPEPVTVTERRPKKAMTSRI